jgi:hypothetical protein
VKCLTSLGKWILSLRKRPTRLSGSLLNHAGDLAKHAGDSAKLAGDLAKHVGDFF